MLDQHIVDALLVFVRIGSCFMVVPGLSTARVPVRVRLYLALAMSLVVAPVMEGGKRIAGSELTQMIATEFLAGLTIGIAARIFMEMLEFMGAAISNYIGLSWLSTGFDNGEAQPTLAILLTAISTLMLMLMEFPHHLIAAVVQSYVDIPRASLPDAAAMLRHFVASIAGAFFIGIQISAPFLIYGLVLNSMFGILGKLAPQFPSFFISGPFIMLGGLLLLYLVSGSLVQVLSAALFSLSRQ